MSIMYTILISDPATGGHLVNGPATKAEVLRYRDEFGFQSGQFDFPFHSPEGLICLLQRDGKVVRTYP